MGEFQLNTEVPLFIRTGEICVGVCMGDELMELGSDIDNTGGYEHREEADAELVFLFFDNLVVVVVVVVDWHSQWLLIGGGRGAAAGCCW